MSSTNRVSLYLDPQIRDWVLFPITLVMVCESEPSSWCYLLTTSFPRFLLACCDIMSWFYCRPRPRSCLARRFVNSVFVCHLLMMLSKILHTCRRALARSQILRATSAKSPIPPLYYKTISQNLSEAFKAGTYLKDGPPKGDSPMSASNPLSDPAAMDGMMAGMKTQMVMMVPQMVIMGWINFFFQGFVLSASQPELL